MKKKFRYILIYFPFFLGVILFSFNIINLFSSLCFFVGGYISIKNTFDYRLLRKNKNYGNNELYVKKDINNNMVSSVVKSRKRERIRVRKK